MIIYAFGLSYCEINAITEYSLTYDSVTSFQNISVWENLGKWQNLSFLRENYPS